PFGSQLDGSTLLVSYSDVAGGWAGEGNLDADPLFDLASGLYHLTSGSPCVDTGSPGAEFSDPEDPARPGSALLPALGSWRHGPGASAGPGPVTAVPAAPPPAQNRPPDCRAASASVPVLTQNEERGLQLESILGVSDPEGSPVTIRIPGVTQDEPIL